LGNISTKGFPTAVIEAPESLSARTDVVYEPMVMVVGTYCNCLGGASIGSMRSIEGLSVIIFGCDICFAVGVCELPCPSIPMVLREEML